MEWAMDKWCGRQQHVILIESVVFCPGISREDFSCLPALHVQTCLCEGRVFVTCLPEAPSVRTCQRDMLLCGIVQPQALLSLYLNIGLKALMPLSGKENFCEGLFLYVYCSSHLSKILV